MAGAILVPCSSRKSVRPATEATAVSLPKAEQSVVETAWRDRLSRLPVDRAAGLLYAGRGLHLARCAATATRAPLYIVSAGLGLVAAERAIPAYGLTVGGRGPESLAPRVTGRLDPSAWWRAVAAGPYATNLAALFETASLGPVLVALTQPYARLLAAALDDLGETQVARLRIFGIRLAEHLPARAARQVLPYDHRLEALFPGTKGDFAQRALLHFTENVLPAAAGGDVGHHVAFVSRILSGLRLPERPVRARHTDGEIVELIARRLSGTRAIGRLLAQLRHEDGVACEQARFTRLYHQAMQRSAA